MFLAVSMNVSPLDRLETLAVKSCVSAESRLAARLKLVRVRVEVSKNRLKTTGPARRRFLRLRADLGERLRRVEDRHDLLARQLLQAEQMGACPGDRIQGHAKLRVGQAF